MILTPYGPLPSIYTAEPYLYFRAHDSSVRSLEFGNNEVRLASSSEITSRSKNSDVPPRPHLLMSSGSDGRLLMHDLRDSFGYMALQRVRGFILASAWCSSSNFIIFNDTDHFIRIMNLSDYLDPSLMQRSVENTMDRNVRTGGLMFHEACIWVS